MSKDVRIKLNGETAIDGAKLLGNVALVTGDTVSYNEGSWVGGVDDSDGYVIIGDTDTSGLIGRTTGGGTGIVTEMTPTFWKANGLTNEDLIELVNRIPGSPGNISSSTEARNWLTTQDRFIISNDYSDGDGGGGNYTLGDYMLSTQYSPAPLDGFISFPAHPVVGGPGGQSVTNPNLVGTNDGEYEYQLYINSRDSLGNDSSVKLDQLIGNSGTLTLTQGSDSVTYTFTNRAFQTGYPDQVGQEPVYFYDSRFVINGESEASPLGAVSVLTPSLDHFNTVDPITITVTIS